VKRVLTAIGLILFSYLILKQAPVWVGWLTLGGFAWIGAREMVVILTRLDHRPWGGLALLGTWGVMAAFTQPEPQLSPVLVGILVLLLLSMVLARASAADAVNRMLGSMFVVLYLGTTFGHLIGLLSTTAPEVSDRGQDLFALALIAVYCGDTCAYYGGKRWGRHKLAPKISPGKTVEGAICGVIGAIIGALAGPYWFFLKLPVVHAVSLGLILGIAGIFGDLAESMLKRAADVKDSGGVFPGHGGLLDRIDSLLLAAPILYWYHRWLLSAL
jgi:phosphatidate cytidylyltransferase